MVPASKGSTTDQLTIRPRVSTASAAIVESAPDESPKKTSCTNRKGIRKAKKPMNTVMSKAARSVPHVRNHRPLDRVSMARRSAPATVSRSRTTTGTAKTNRM